MTASSVLASCHKRTIRGIFALVCPRAASGHATAPPSTPRNAHRFMSNPRLRRRHRNDKNEHFGRGAGMDLGYRSLRRTTNVSDGSNASIPPCPRHVRFDPNSDHKADMPAGRFGANWQHFAPQQTDPRFLRGWIRREATIVYPGTGGANDVATATSMPAAAREHVPNPIRAMNEITLRIFTDACDSRVQILSFAPLTSTNIS